MILFYLSFPAAAVIVFFLSGKLGMPARIAIALTVFVEKVTDLFSVHFFQGEAPNRPETFTTLR